MENHGKELDSAKKKFDDDLAKRLAEFDAEKKKLIE